MNSLLLLLVMCLFNTADPLGNIRRSATCGRSQGAPSKRHTTQTSEAKINMPPFAERLEEFSSENEYVEMNSADFQTILDTRAVHESEEYLW